MPEIQMSSTYGKIASMQRSAVLTTMQMNFFEEALQGCLCDLAQEMQDLSKPFVIAEYGVADGVNSLPILEAIIPEIQRRCIKKPIRLYLCDLPSNNWSKLRSNTRHLIEEHPQLEIIPVAKSFYEQVIVDGSVHLGYSSTALSWLPKAPAYTRNQAYTGPQNDDAKDAKAWDSYSKKCLDVFYQHRYAELSAGGRLVILSVVRDENGLVNGNIPNWAKRIEPILQKFGVDQENMNFTLPVVLRSPQEMRTGENQGFRELRNYVFSSHITPYLGENADYELIITSFFKSIFEHSYRTALLEQTNLTNPDIEEALEMIFDAALRPMKKLLRPETLQQWTVFPYMALLLNKENLIAMQENFELQL